MVKIQSRFWIEKDKQKIFGKGPCVLLKNVDRFGSLNKAANELNMSYSKAWTIIKKAENILGYELLETEIGGVDGGGSRTTSKAKALIKAYEGFCNEAEIAVEEIFQKHLYNI